MPLTFDGAWQARAVAGDRQAAAELAQRALAPLYSFCLYRLGRNHHLCEEVVQETLVRAIGEVERYEPERSGGDAFPWLTGLARNEIASVLAREKGKVSLDSLWANMDRELLQLYARLDSEPFNDELLQREETRQLVNATMSQLPPHYREALEAKYVAGKSVHELAVALRQSEKAVESLLTRARQAFRATFTTLARNLGTEA